MPAAPDAAAVPADVGAVVDVDRLRAEDGNVVRNRRRETRHGHLDVAPFRRARHLDLRHLGLLQREAPRQQKDGEESKPAFHFSNLISLIFFLSPMPRTTRPTSM